MIEEDIKKKLEIIEKCYESNVIRNEIEKIEIYNLDKLGNDISINFNFPLTIIVGKNGTGKTTIMRAIKLLENNMKNEFFHIILESGNFNGTKIKFKLSNNEIIYECENEELWNINEDVKKKLNLKYIQTKSMIGAIDKGLMYDNISIRNNRDDVKYIKRQTRKIIQNTQTKSSKKRCIFLNAEELENVNYILQRNFKSIEIIKHRYYNGTFGVTVIFEENSNKYVEYNAGSGEFVIARMIFEIGKMPNNSVILLDEPEVSLHPGAQKRFMNYILKQIITKKLQVIITTHSPIIVENMPTSSIKCLKRNNENNIIIDEEVFYKNAFLELEYNSVGQKFIIVEDKLAKKIINKIIDIEKLNELVRVDYYPGGASNIKSSTILTYSKTNIDNHYIIFDGDQKMQEIQDLSLIPEKNITIEYLTNILEKSVGIKKINFGVDGNSKKKTCNNEQKLILMKSYIEYYKRFVDYLPGKIPEDIIYNRDRLNTLFGEKIKDFRESADNKKNLKQISDKTGYVYDSLEDDLIYYFGEQKNEDYKYILNIIKKIIEK